MCDLTLCFIGKTTVKGCHNTSTQRSSAVDSNEKNQMNTPSHALHHLHQGFKLIQHKSVRGFILWPIIINVFLFVCVSIYAYGEMMNWIESWMSSLHLGIAFLTSIIKCFVILFLIIAVMFSFAIVTTLITAPFYCLVAEKVAIILNHPVPITPMTIEAMWQLCWRSLSRELQKLLYYLPRVLLLIIITVIPATTVISPILWSLWGAWLMSIQFIDYAADNDAISAYHCRTLLGKEKINTLLLGGLLMLGMLVPVLNIMMGVVAVAAATSYWIALYKPTQHEIS